MKFFMPFTVSPEHEQGLYEDIKESLSKELGADYSQRRIFALDWMHDGMRHYAEVGRPTDVSGETVIAILYDTQADLYHVCTPERGVLSGMPIVAQASSVMGSRDFNLS